MPTIDPNFLSNNAHISVTTDTIYIPRLTNHSERYITTDRTGDFYVPPTEVKTLPVELNKIQENFEKILKIMEELKTEKDKKAEKDEKSLELNWEQDGTAKVEIPMAGCSSLRSIFFIAKVHGTKLCIKHQNFDHKFDLDFNVEVPLGTEIIDAVLNDGLLVVNLFNDNYKVKGFNLLTKDHF